jgi:hypothetical protein
MLIGFRNQAQGTNGQNITKDNNNGDMGGNRLGDNIIQKRGAGQVKYNSRISSAQKTEKGANTQPATW